MAQRGKPLDVATIKILVRAETIKGGAREAEVARNTARKYKREPKK